MTNQPARPLFSRLWDYQKERFPVFKHGLLIAAFSSSAVSLSALLRGQTVPPDAEAYAVSFIVLSTLFFQLRVADEFKDAAQDARYRPERPIPRGLITLKELGWAGAGTALLQFFTVFFYYPPLVIILLGVWGYMGLMSAEFFVAEWLKANLFIYMLSHMLIMPLIDLFATACDWLVKAEQLPNGLVWFLIVSFFNGAIIEVGRKTWIESMEREGVESYSSYWGTRRALIVWGLSILASLICSLIVAVQIDFVALPAIVLGFVLAVMINTALKLFKYQKEAYVKTLENISGIWVFCVYLTLGIVPMGVKAWL